VPDAEKRLKKTQVFQDLSLVVKAKRSINNATLVQYKTYGTGRAEFKELYEACGKDWGRFLKVLSTLKESSFGKPQQEDLAPVLLPLAREKRCGG
jgi:predicted aminopeptidase